MTDFVAVLRKTIDGVSENTPQVRQKVYAKARSTVEAKLAAINPPPPKVAADRQRKALEDAIAKVEADYAPKPANAAEDDLESIFASLNAPIAPKPPAVKPIDEPVAEATPIAPPPGPAAQQSPAPADPGFDSGYHVPDEPEIAEPELGEQPAAAPRRNRAPRGKSRRGVGLIATLVVLLIICAGGYGVWINREDIASAMGVDLGAINMASLGLGDDQPATVDAGDTPVTPASSSSAEKTTIVTPRDSPPAAQPSDAAPQTSGPAAADDDEVQKFTQRLQSDGTEVDTGPAGGTPTIGEGSTVAAATQPAADPVPAGDSAARASDETAAGTTGADEAALPVGQRAIFYEERTNSAEGSAESGSIVWSLIQESPGGDAPPEPAIRAEARIPGKDLQLRMTIRRNTDASLPASHIIEMIFLTPDDFEGGGIDNVLRVALKSSEAAAGNPLIGIPAKIADGYFLIALSDTAAETETNLTLLRRQSWIDIPIVYKSGRRALVTLEKGLPGDKVFNEAMQAWQTKSSG